MIYFSTAMYYEASPIIEKYNMKKLTEVSRFQIFKGHDACLVISGIGGTSSAIATTYMLTLLGANEKDFFVNVGICGSVYENFSIGDTLLCNKIINNPSGKIFFPDMLVRHPFREASLETFAKPVTSDYASHVKGKIVDMEGAFAYEAASKFIPPHKIFVIKVVSDYAKPDSVTPENIKSLMTRSLDVIFPWLLQTTEFFDKGEGVISEDESSAIADICRKLKFSKAMTAEIERLAVKYKVRNGGFEKFFTLYGIVEAKDKNEGKKYFSNMKNTLLE